MDFIPADFHFLRPLWLLALVPAGLLFWGIRRLKTDNSWSRAIDQDLLPYLLDGKTGRRERPLLQVLLFGWLLASLGLAGPAWEKLPQPVRKKADALVIVQDLSLSMYATDLSPNRLTRARRKLVDILAERREGTTALVVYSGDAHVVSPLTDDTNTISAMVPDLSPSIMPAYGSNLPEAISRALQLIEDASVGGGRVLLITDEVEESQVGRVSELLAEREIVLSVLGVGTGDGGPIPKNDGGFLSDDRGNIVIPRLNRGVLRDLAAETGGRYSDLRLDNADFEYLLAAGSLKERSGQYRQVDREFDQWREEGYWLILAILPLALLPFRRGWLLGLVMILLLSGTEAEAMSWQDLWLRKNQQGVKALDNNDPEKAAELFETPQWQGIAEYRAGNYEGAAESFAELDDGESSYNRGNALTRQGRLEEALEAYDQALRHNPEFEDARHNKELVEQMIRQQRQQAGEGREKESAENQQENKADQDQSRRGNDQNREQQEQGQDLSRDRAEAAQKDENQQGEEQGKQQAPEEQSEDGQAGKASSDDSAAPGEDPDRKGDSEKQAGKGEESSTAQSDREGEPPQSGIEDQLSKEERQALEQWLRRIPDNPGGLLKRKFEYQYQQNQNRNPSNNRKIW